MRHCGAQHHFIGTCRFHLATLLDSGYVVSTVGEYPDALNDGQDQPLGAGRDDLYETMVFHAAPVSDDHPCGVEPDVHRGVQETVRYATPRAANEGHVRLCTEWSGRDPQATPTEVTP